MRYRYGFAALLLALAGCGDNVVLVSGRVTLDQKPLANAKVVFQPEAEKDKQIVGPGSIGTTDADGRFTLQLMNGNAKGAIVGKHKVSISAYKVEGDAGKPAHLTGFGTPLVPARYNAQTTLTFEVSRGGNSNANFDLKSDPD